MIKLPAESVEFSTAALIRHRANKARPALIALAGYFSVCAVQAQGQVIYPVGFEWNRFADWTIRPDSDANTANGNPDDDQSGRPVWKYETWDTGAVGGGIGSAQPWYVENFAFQVITLHWNPHWVGTGPPCWSISTTTGPVIFDSVLLHFLPNNSANYYRPTVVKFTYPGSCLLRAQLTGQITVSWYGFMPANNTAPIDVALVIRRASGVIEPLILQTVPRPPGVDHVDIPVNFEVTLAQGDGFTITHRGTATDPNSWNGLTDDMLTLTSLENMSSAFIQQPQDIVACVGDTAIFAVTAPSIPGTVQYLWRHDGEPLENSGHIDGVDTATLTIADVTLADGIGDYDCIVTNDCGSVTSDPATLEVVIDDVSPVLVHIPMPGEPGSSPHSGFVDARAESTDGQSFNMGLDALTFVFDEPVYRIGGETPDVTSFVVTSTGGTAPGIASVDASQNPVIRVVFNSPPPLREWTTVRAEVEDFCGNPIVNNGDLGPGALEPDRIDFLFLPGDVNQSRTVNPLDLVRFKQIINGLYVPPQGTNADYVDMNRSGGVNPLDLVRFKQLINGISPATQTWPGATPNQPQP